MNGAADVLTATGAGSVIDARSGTQITVNDPGRGIFMENGGLVYIDNTTNLHVNAPTGGFGIGILGTTVPAGVIGSGVTIHLDFPNASATGLELNTSSATFDNLTVTGSGSGFAVQVAVDSTLTLTGTAHLDSSAAGGAVLKASGTNAVITGDACANISHDDGNSIYGAVAATGGGQIELTCGMDITAAGNFTHGVYAESAGSFVDATHGTKIEMTGTGSSSTVTMALDGLVKLDGTTKIDVLGPDDIGISLWDTKRA